MKKQRVREKNEAFMNNPRPGEWSSFINHPLQSATTHTQNSREKRRARQELGETEDGDTEQQTRLWTSLTFLTLEDV